MPTTKLIPSCTRGKHSGTTLICDDCSFVFCPACGSERLICPSCGRVHAPVHASDLRPVPEIRLCRLCRQEPTARENGICGDCQFKEDQGTKNADPSLIPQPEDRSGRDYLLRASGCWIAVPNPKDPTLPGITVYIFVARDKSAVSVELFRGEEDNPLGATSLTFTVSTTDDNPA